MAILELQHVTYVYGGKKTGKVTAVNDVSFSVNAGEVIGIIGHTGSGKSTLIQQFNGLLRPTSGKVLVNGKDIWEQPKKIRQVRFQVGMVFQYPEYQLFEETVEKDIGFGPRNQKLSEAAVASRVDDAVAFVGLEPSLRKKSPFSLSGGEKRRAAIAGVIAMDPDILVLDEPTAGLDPQGREALMGQIMAYHKQRKNTIILVSHSMEDVAELADRVLVMDKGSVAMFDTVAEVFSRGAELEQMGLRVPQITQIMALLAKKGYPVLRNIFTLEQAVAQLLPMLKGGDRLGS